MKRLLMIVVPVLLLLGGFLIWWTQPEKVVARRVASMLRAANVEAGSSSIVKGTRGQAVEKYLAPRVTLDGEVSDDSDYAKQDWSRADLVTNYSALASSATSISIQEPDIETVEVFGDTATVTANVDVSIEIGGSKLMRGAQKMVLTWQKNPEGWQLTKANWKAENR